MIVWKATCFSSKKKLTYSNLHDYRLSCIMDKVFWGVCVFPLLIFFFLLRSVITIICSFITNNRRESSDRRMNLGVGLTKYSQQ